MVAAGDLAVLETETDDDEDAVGVVTGAEDVVRTMVGAADPVLDTPPRTVVEAEADEDPVAVAVAVVDPVLAPFKMIVDPLAVAVALELAIVDVGGLEAVTVADELAPEAVTVVPGVAITVADEAVALVPGVAVTVDEAEVVVP